MIEMFRKTYEKCSQISAYNNDPPHFAILTPVARAYAYIGQHAVALSPHCSQPAAVQQQTRLSSCACVDDGPYNCWTNETWEHCELFWRENQNKWRNALEMQRQNTIDQNRQ